MGRYYYLDMCRYHYLDTCIYYYLATFMGMTWRLQQLGGLSVGTEEVGSTCRLLTT